MNRLASLGLRQAQLSLLTPDELEQFALARVSFISHTHCTVLTEEGDVAAELHPRVRDPIDPVVVGDWVLIDLRGDPSWVVRKLPAEKALVRRDPGGGAQTLAAWVDLAVVVHGLDREISPRRMERWAAIARPAGIDFRVALTKADLADADQIEAARAAIREVVGDVGVVVVSGAEDTGVEALRAWIRGQTAALVGLSGVGKSTLVNRLLGAELQATGGVRDRDQRGRHTTTARYLLEVPGGGWLFDMPGIRQIAPVGDVGDLGSAFPEVEALLGACRFRDCAHRGEPGCAVEAALESGELGWDRWAAFQKLEREMAFEHQKTDPDAARAIRDKWKRIHKVQREKTAERRRRQ